MLNELLFVEIITKKQLYETNKNTILFMFTLSCR